MFISVCYKSFSLIFGGDGAGGTVGFVLEFFAFVEVAVVTVVAV